MGLGRKVNLFLKYRHHNKYFASELNILTVNVFPVWNRHTWLNGPPETPGTSLQHCTKVFNEGPNTYRNNKLTKPLKHQYCTKGFKEGPKIYQNKQLKSNVRIEMTVLKFLATPFPIVSS